MLLGGSGTPEGKGWPPLPIPYILWHMPGHGGGKVLSAVSQAVSGSWNSPCLLYKGQALHLSKASGASKEPE